jgi:hypothetical protein
LENINDCLVLVPFVWGKQHRNIRKISMNDCLVLVPFCLKKKKPTTTTKNSKSIWKISINDCHVFVPFGSSRRGRGKQQ